MEFSDTLCAHKQTYLFGVNNYQKEIYYCFEWEFQSKSTPRETVNQICIFKNELKTPGLLERQYLWI